MALKIELKPGERIILGQAVITNGDSRTRLVVEGEAPILREKDILTAREATTTAKRIYLAVQLMYLNNSIERTQHDYLTLIRDFISNFPNSTEIIEKMSKEILTGLLYKALKSARKLIEYEEELLSHEQRSASLCQGREDDS
jgi:flagellar protein FlbT